MKVCIFGASSNSLSEEYYTAAEKLGHLLAESGHTLVYGGSEKGIMRACADGIVESGGKLIGVAPSFFKDFGVLSSRCSEIIYSSTMSERKQIMEDISDAFIVLPGGVGTFDEFFETMTLKQLNIHSKPLALLNTLGYYNELITMLECSADKGFMSAGCLNLYKICDTPDQAVEYIQSSEAASIKGRGLNYD